MSSFQYYSAPGFGQVAREEYGFSDACIIGDRMEVTGQVGFLPDTLKIPESLEDEIAQAFENLSSVILFAIDQSKYPVKREQGKEVTAWDYVVKITSYHVNLLENRPALKEIMVRMLKDRFPNHQPLFTMVGIESLPLGDTNVEIEACVHLR